MRNHFFLILMLASLFAFVQKFAEGEINFFTTLARAPAQASANTDSWVITPETTEIETTEYNASTAR